MKIVRKVALFVSLVAFLGAGGYLGYDYYVSAHEQQELDALSSVVKRAETAYISAGDVPVDDGGTLVGDGASFGEAASGQDAPQSVASGAAAPAASAQPTQPAMVEVVQKGATDPAQSQDTDAMAALIRDFIRDNPEFASLPMETVQLDVQSIGAAPADAVAQTQAPQGGSDTQAQSEQSVLVWGSTPQPVAQPSPPPDASGMSKGQQLLLKQLGKDTASTVQPAADVNIQVRIAAPEGASSDLQSQLDIAAAKMQAYIKGHTINADLKTGRIDFSVHKAKAAILPQYAELYAENSDMVGWIRIDGTKVDFPLMQTPSDSEYYLQRGFDKQFARSGLPFVDARCNLDNPEGNILVYGHNMKGGKMFAQLKYYEDQAYWRRHKIVHLDLLRETREYQVIGAFRFKQLETDEDGFRYYDFMNLSELGRYNQFVAQLKKLQMYNTGLQPVWGDQLLIMTTCSYHADNGKFVVVARRTK